MSLSRMAAQLASRQHIQDHSAAHDVEYHWGYASRVVPCVVDAGSCEYLDAVYWMHDVSMLYTFIMWAVIGGILAVAIGCRLFKPSSKTRSSNKGSDDQIVNQSSSYYRVCRGIRAFFRRWLLPESLTRMFGSVTRLQLLILTIILGYLLIFSLVGIVYKKWITPVKNTNLFNTRTGLGGFSDRVGALAYALTPLTIALASRESILTLLTGVPYQSFNFMHRWLGRIIFIQSWIHTIGWTIIEAKLYQPQPKVWNNFIKQLYMIWGCIALIFINFLFVFSLSKVVKLTGHEFFRKAHYIVGMLYIGSCWGHWNQLACWMIASLGVWGLDRGLRLLRTLLIHTGKLDASKGFGFHPAQSSIQYFDDEDGGIVRLEFSHNHDSWAVGQHFFLCFPALSIWQSHPFTTISVPTPHSSVPRHVYIARCRKGETARLKKLALTQVAENSKTETTSVILCGPYGTNLLPRNVETTNTLAIAGGTGVSLTLPFCCAAAATPAFAGAAIDFIWIIRRSSNMQWITNELEELKTLAKKTHINLQIQIYITQESSPLLTTSDTITPPPSSEITNSKPSLEITTTSLPTEISPFFSSAPSISEKPQPFAAHSLHKSEESNPNFNITNLPSHHPSIQALVSTFIETRANTACRTRVIASGPRGMGRDLRAAAAGFNDGEKVLKGERRWDVSLEWDDRG